jgi:hypothetical protein
MKLLGILGKVGSAVIKTIVPGGGLIIDVVNEFLPDDKKLPTDATGSDMQQAVDSLPPEQRAQLMGREFDVQIEAHHTLQAMLRAEQASTHTTRPQIALGSFRLVAFVTIVVVSLWAYAVAIQNEKLVAAVVDGWPFVAAVIAPFVTLLWAYFGILKNEQRNRLNAANGSTASGLGGIISNMLKRS